MAPISWHPINSKDWKSKKKTVQNLWCKNILKPSNHIKVAKLTLAWKWPNFGCVNANATTTFPQGFGAIPLKESVQSRWRLPDSKVGEVSLMICPKRNPRTARKTPTFFRKNKKLWLQIRFLQVGWGVFHASKTPLSEKTKTPCVSKWEDFHSITVDACPTEQKSKQKLSEIARWKVDCFCSSSDFLSGLVPTVRCDYLVGSMKGFFHQK